MADIPHHKEAICAKRKKVTEQFLRNLTKYAKIATGGHLGGPGGPKNDSNQKSPKTPLSFAIMHVHVKFEINSLNGS